MHIFNKDIILKKQGFTLVEILVVVAIIAIVALLTVPSMTKWVSAKKITESTNKLVQLMYYAREESVSSSLIYKIEYNNEVNGISIQTYIESYPSGSLTCTGDNWINDVKQPKKIMISNEKEINIWTCNNSNNCNKNENTICFYPHGGASHKIIQIKDQSDRETHMRKIQTSSATGFIEVFRRENNDWISN